MQDFAGCPPSRDSDDVRQALLQEFAGSFHRPRPSAIGKFSQGKKLHASRSLGFAPDEVRVAEMVVDGFEIVGGRKRPQDAH